MAYREGAEEMEVRVKVDSFKYKWGVRWKLESREVGVRSELQITKDVEGIGRVKSKLGVRVVWDLEWDHYLGRENMFIFPKVEGGEM